MTKKELGSLENKKTSELLDSIAGLVDETGHLLDGYEEVLAELKSREPFYSLYKPRADETLSEELDGIDEEIKKLKRHKHDEKTGDVMIRV